MKSSQLKQIPQTYQGQIKNYKTNMQLAPKVAQVLDINGQFFNENNINITERVNAFETLIATSRLEAEEIALAKRSYFFLVLVKMNKEKSPSFLWYGIPN